MSDFDEPEARIVLSIVVAGFVIGLGVLLFVIATG